MSILPRRNAAWIGFTNMALSVQLRRLEALLLDVVGLLWLDKLTRPVLAAHHCWEAQIAHSRIRSLLTATTLF